MQFSAMFRVVALALALGPSCNEAQKAPSARAAPELSRSASNQLRATKSELTAERRILAMVQKQESDTAAKLSEKKVKAGKLTEQLQKLKQLNAELRSTEKEKDEVIHQAKALKALPKEQATLGLISLEEASDEDLEETSGSRAEQQAAEMSSLSAQAMHYRSEIQKIKQNLSSAELATERAQQEAGPLLQVEQKEAHAEALLQEKVQSRSASARATRARQLARGEQHRVLSKEQELASLNYAIGNSTLLLQQASSGLQAQHLHVQDSAREATVLTDHLASKEDQLKRFHNEVINLNQELAKKYREMDALHAETAELQGRIKKDLDAGSKNVTSLLQQLEQKDAQLKLLKQNVTRSEGQVEEVMSTLRGYIDRSKAKLRKTKYQALLQETQVQEKATAGSSEIQAARRQNAALKAELSAKLQEVESRAAAQEAAEVEMYQKSHNTAAAETMQSVTKARVQAQKHENERQMKRSSLIQTRLQAEARGSAALAESSVSGSASETHALHESITKAKAFEAVRLSKVNKQTAEMMKTAKSLQFAYEASKVDQLMSKEAAAAQRIEKANREEEETQIEYDDAKRRVEQIYVAMRSAEPGLEADEVRRLTDKLKDVTQHKEHAVSLLKDELQDAQEGITDDEAGEVPSPVSKHLRTTGTAGA